MSSASVLISEVGPRDGLQSVKATMPTAHKRAWIDALHAAGLREIEVGSFVPAKLLPQMADAADVVRHAVALPNWTVMALVPNRKGAEAEYLKLFCIVYINLLRRNLDGAAMHARRSKFLKANLLVRSIFPIPDLEEKVLFQNSIEAIG